MHKVKRGVSYKTTTNMFVMNIKLILKVSVRGVML